MKYRVNPFCPSCKEEHAYFEIDLSTDEEKALNQLNEDMDRENLNEIGKFLKAKPIILLRTFRCPVCGYLYKAKIPVYTFNRVDWVSSESVGVGLYRV